MCHVGTTVTWRKYGACIDEVMVGVDTDPIMGTATLALDVAGRVSVERGVHMWRAAKELHGAETLDAAASDWPEEVALLTSQKHPFILPVVEMLRAALRNGADCTVRMTNYRRSGDTFDNLLSLRPGLLIGLRPEQLRLAPAGAAPAATETSLNAKLDQV